MARKRATAEETPLDMTPMIDCVFQLLIFFILVIDLSQKELEDITLPRASECEKDDPKDADFRKIVNLKTDGTIIVKREPMDLEALKANLFAWRNSGLWKNDLDGFCAKPILIRTDRGTEMKHVQKVMQICGIESLKIWKIELACSQDSPGYHGVEDPTVLPQLAPEGQ